MQDGPFQSVDLDKRDPSSFQSIGFDKRDPDSFQSTDLDKRDPGLQNGARYEGCVDDSNVYVSDVIINSIVMCTSWSVPNILPDVIPGIAATIYHAMELAVEASSDSATSIGDVVTGVETGGAWAFQLTVGTAQYFQPDALAPIFHDAVMRMYNDRVGAMRFNIVNTAGALIFTVFLAKISNR